MNSKKIYTLSNIRTLIDLNGDSINFEATFNIVSKNKEPFYVLVIDQTTLDNNPNHEYKIADKGQISGTITQDKNVYQNFFILLKADKPCECEVEISKKDLPKNNNIVIPQPISQSPPTQEEKKDSFNLFKLLFIIGGILTIAYLFYVYSKKDGKNIEKQTGNIKVYSPSKSEKNSDSSPENPLLSRLKNLKV